MELEELESYFLKQLLENKIRIITINEINPSIEKYCLFNRIMIQLMELLMTNSKLLKITLFKTEIQK